MDASRSGFHCLQFALHYALIISDSVILNLVPAASYYRLRSDAASYMNESGHSHQTVEPSNQSSWRDLLENVTIEYAFNELGWWQQSDRYSHQFVIAVFENLRLPSQRIYVRIERDKDAWTPWHGGNLETIFTSSFIEAALTAQSFCVAKYTVNSTFLRRNEYTPSSISAVIQEINKYSSTYSFLAFNCWWFAACSFFCIAHCIKPEHLTIYCRQEAYHELEESTFEQAMSFCDVYYLKSHWPYWILVGHPVIVLTACFSLLTNWCILAYTIPPLLIGVWLTYYIVRIAGAWRGVRRVARCEGLGAERSINLKLACSVAAIVIALMLYSALFLVLAFSPRLAVTRGEVGR
ncbi:hypothetical protein FRB98_008873 [Tulasnella sp. 332]|nr:hypothetical protein FRB98_008873 [Tulasnella sp. 332]